MRVLVTGGAGFIGQKLTTRLLAAGHEIAVYDNFSPQIHRNTNRLPAAVVNQVRLMNADVADRASLEPALEWAEAVVHLAAETGTGQSMYEVERYARTNLSGTALIYDIAAKNRAVRLERVVVASSRAIYGEGAYRCAAHGLVYPEPQPSERKRQGIFDPECPQCGGALSPAQTPEDAPLHASSFYGLTKLAQEQTVLLFGRALGIPSVSLRYQNVFGPGQSLINPYTGILAIFSNLARVGKTINIFEDGEESRDFVYIDDAVEATAAALSVPLERPRAINVGSGTRTTVRHVAESITAHFGGRSEIAVTGAYREGDIRHGSADLSLGRAMLGYVPHWDFASGLREFLLWAAQSEPSLAGYEKSLGEMRERGLFKG